MSQTLRDRILAEALKEIPFNGLSEATLAAAAKEAGASVQELRTLFPHGPASLAEIFSHRADAEMAAHMEHECPERVRDRIAFAVRARIEALAPYREAARRTAAFLALPPNAVLASKLLMASVDAMWRAAGDRSSDFNYYTKRALLAGVYGATLLYWFSDSSEGHAATWRFLDSRIADVMRIQKMRGDLKRGAAKLHDPFSLFATLRARMRHS